MNRQRHPTSMRFNENEVALLNAWAAYLSATTGIGHSRTDVILRLLSRVPPPDDHTAVANDLRLAYTAIFGPINRGKDT